MRSRVLIVIGLILNVQFPVAIFIGHARLRDNFAHSLDDKALASRSEPSLNKRKRGFESMDDFYKGIAGWKQEGTEILKHIFGFQKIKLHCSDRCGT